MEASRAAVSTVAAVLASGADWIASNAAFFMASDDLVAIDTVSQLLFVSSVADCQANFAFNHFDLEYALLKYESLPDS